MQVCWQNSLVWDHDLNVQNTEQNQDQYLDIYIKSNYVFEYATTADINWLSP